MNKIKCAISACLSFCILLSLSACSWSFPDSDNIISKSIITSESEMSITSSKENIDMLIAANKDFTDDNTKRLFNITPKFIADNSDFLIFKYSDSAQSFIMYDNEVYSIGICFGGYGITNMALADLNRDGQYELYYTFSWGSGIHRSQIGYFDPADRQINIFNYHLRDFDMMLTVNQAGDLCVNKSFPDINSMVDFSVTPLDLLGTVSFENDKTVLNIEQNKYYACPPET